MHRASPFPVSFESGAERFLNARSQDVLAQSVGDSVIEHRDEPLSVQNTIRRYHDSLIHFLQQRLRVPEDAHDVAQEAYVRLLQYQNSTSVRSPSSMLFRIAINVANDLGRADKVRHIADQCPVDEVELVSEQPSAERELSAVEDLALLRAAIAGLPPKCRQVFLLSRVRQMTYPQIARHCGISVKMVEKHISHALAICAKKVGGDDFEPS
jgi:RNA polymerase sigma factor (sigma-70 family)